jgi:presequence protease
MELIKGSLKTFLNAMTFLIRPSIRLPARTCKTSITWWMCTWIRSFSRSSTAPPFEQEGWHYELEKPGDPLSIRASFTTR